MPQQHIEDDSLDLYSLGRLPGDAAADVEEHLLLCGACRERLRQSDEFAALFRQTATLPEARPQRRSAGRRWRAAAGFAAAALSVFLVLTTRREGAPVSAAVVSLEAMRGPETPARIEAGKPAILVFDIDMETGARYEAHIVDRDGKDVLRPRTESKQGRLSVNVGRLRRGTYWVRVYRADAGGPIAEYGLESR